MQLTTLELLKIRNIIHVYPNPPQIYSRAKNENPCDDLACHMKSTGARVCYSELLIRPMYFQTKW